MFDRARFGTNLHVYGIDDPKLSRSEISLYLGWFFRGTVQICACFFVLFDFVFVLKFDLFVFA